MEKAVKSINDLDLSDLKLPLIVLYDHPRDYPGHVAARVWESAIPQPTNTVILYDSLAAAEEELSIFTKLPRNDSDDPVILCSYLV